MLKVPARWCVYTQKPDNGQMYTDKMNRIYTRFAKAYDGFIRLAPFWSEWLSQVLNFDLGKKVLEVSFGPGYLLTKYPETSNVYGLDYNGTMVHRAKVKVLKARRKAKLVEGNVEAMPYPDNFFDTIVNTMAFSGYPDGDKAMSEMLRVLKPEGQLLLIDYDYPPNRDVRGYLLVKFIELCGDVMKDIGKIVESQGATYTRKMIGAYGSVQLFDIRKQVDGIW